MLGSMSQHLRVIVGLLDDLTLKDMETRLANWLLKRCPRPITDRAVEIELGRTKRVLAAFLQNPKLGMDPLVALIQPPLRPPQVEALATSRWREVRPVADQVLRALDRTLALPDSGLALGHAAPWIKAMDEDARILAASRILTPALRRMVHPRREREG